METYRLFSLFSLTEELWDLLDLLSATNKSKEPDFDDRNGDGYEGEDD